MRQCILQGDSETKRIIGDLLLDGGVEGWRCSSNARCRVRNRRAVGVGEEGFAIPLADGGARTVGCPCPLDAWLVNTTSGLPILRAGSIWLPPPSAHPPPDAVLAGGAGRMDAAPRSCSPCQPASSYTHTLTHTISRLPASSRLNRFAPRLDTLPWSPTAAPCEPWSPCASPRPTPPPGARPAVHRSRRQKYGQTPGL